MTERGDGLLEVADPLTDAGEASGKASATSIGKDDAWSVFVDARSMSAYCASWLALQCGAIAGTKAAVLLLEEGGAFAPAASWPALQQDFDAVREVAERTLASRELVVLTAGDDGQAAVGDDARDLAIGFPIVVGEVLHGAVVMRLSRRSEEELQLALRQLHWGAGWLDALFWRLQSQQDTARLERAAIALDVLAVVQEKAKPRSAALACANELARRLGCDRVAIGFRRGNRIRMAAISDATPVQRKARWVDLAENAMDEALDQGVSLCLPLPRGSRRRPVVALHSFISAFNLASAGAVAMPGREQTFGVLLLARSDGNHLSGEDLLLAEAIAALAGPVLELKQREVRWFSGRLVDLLTTMLRLLLGPRRPTLKLAALGLAGFLAWLSLATAEFSISAPAVVEGAVQRAAVAPFDGFVASAPARAGDRVERGDVLASLDDRDLRLDVLRWKTQREQALQKMREASAEHDRAAIATHGAQAKQAEAQLRLAEEMLARTRILAPIDGIVVSGDLSQLLGSPVERGKVLFEIAPLSEYRVIVKVDERDTGYVAEGQEGTLALIGIPDARLPVVVRRLTPVATAEEGRNRFRIEASLEEGAAILRPGMEGFVRLAAGERSMVWILTRRMIDWMKLTWWSWRPV